MNINNRGFTLIELLIILVIMGALLAAIVPPFLNFQRTSALNTETQEILTIVSEARLSAMSSKEDVQYGVHFEAGKVVLFKGATYSVGASGNKEHLFNTTLTLSPIVVNGGGADVVFQKVTGATTQNATTTLVVVGNTAASSTIIIYPTGVATMN